MPRALLLLLLAMLLLTATPARAIPTCVPGTLADYLALSDGCRLGAITVSNFSYSGSRESVMGPILDIPASEVDVTPSLPFGAGSLRLTFSSFWTDVAIAYTAQAAAPWIRQFNLFFLAGGGPGMAFIDAAGLRVFIDPFNPFGDTERLFDTRSFDPISLTTVPILGFSAATPHGGIGSFAVDTVTPEPATLLLWGTGAAGLGAVRWWKRRRSHEHAA